MPDKWEFEIFGDLDSGPHDNLDGDRLKNIHELLLATNPNVLNEKFDALDVRAGWNFISKYLYKINGISFQEMQSRKIHQLLCPSTYSDIVDNPTPSRLFGATFRGLIWYWQDGRYKILQPEDLLDYKLGYWVFFEEEQTFPIPLL